MKYIKCFSFIISEPLRLVVCSLWITVRSWINNSVTTNATSVSYKVIGFEVPKAKKSFNLVRNE